MTKPIWTDTEWSMDLINQVYEEIEDIGINELKLDIYPNQIEIISSEQMVDAYTSIGMPIMYNHWSFGKDFVREWESYKKGRSGLAYELVINSSPCINYLMEDNSMTMQALVLAHAACVSGDTEYLSPTGWKRIDSYTGGLVGQYHEDGHVTFVEPSRYIKRDQTDFIHVKSDKIDQAITDDHTVVFINSKGDIDKLSGKELAANQVLDGKFVTGFSVIDHPEWNENSPPVDISGIEFSRIPSVDGKAYCFTVPTGMFVIRRNRKISVTGNCGHNHFFKNNYLFREWTDAEAIVDYLNFSRNFINQAEVKYGEKEVSQFLDAAHAMMKYGVNRYKRPSKVSMDVRKERERQKEEYLRSRVSELDRIAPSRDREEYVDPENVLKDIPEHPEENILYFCEKHGDLKVWQREILRIVRKIGQYFYPQSQTKIMNEGFASRVHYKILTRLHDKGLMTDGSYLEAITSHSGVLFQPMAGTAYYSGFNPYKLGFEIYKDIERICSEPTEEDRRWFPELVGADPWQTVIDAARDYRDESFILQFLSPKVIRDFRLYHVNDVAERDYYLVENIHDDRGYQNIREKLSEMQEWDVTIPNIEITKFDRKTRVLHLQHTDKRGRALSRHNWDPMNRYLSVIWGGPVELVDRAARPAQSNFQF